jgi:hypothetical protein
VCVCGGSASHVPNTRPSGAPSVRYDSGGKGGTRSYLMTLMYNACIPFSLSLSLTLSPPPMHSLPLPCQQGVRLVEQSYQNAQACVDVVREWKRAHTHGVQTYDATNWTKRDSRPAYRSSSARL